MITKSLTSFELGLAQVRDAVSLKGRSQWRLCECRSPCTLCPSFPNQSTLPSFLPLPLLVFMLEIPVLDTLVLSLPL